MSSAVLLQGVLVDGPADGELVSVREGFDFVKVTVCVRKGDVTWAMGVWLYEFDPVTAKDGRWIYRCKGAVIGMLMEAHISIYCVLEVAAEAEQAQEIGEKIDEIREKRDGEGEGGIL